VYRGELNRFESIFAKKGFLKTFSSYAIVFTDMTAIFQEERKNNKQRKELDFQGKSYSEQFRSLTRIEKWRVILLWIFSELIQEHYKNNTYELTTPATGSKKTTMELLVDDLEVSITRKLQKLLSDLAQLEEITEFRPVNVLQQYCRQNFVVIFPEYDFDDFLDRLQTIADGFHDGYQRCSKEVKRFQKLAASPDKYQSIREGIVLKSSVETADDYVINQCMDIIVRVGKELKV